MQLKSEHMFCFCYCSLQSDHCVCSNRDTLEVTALRSGGGMYIFSDGKEGLVKGPALQILWDDHPFLVFWSWLQSHIHALQHTICHVQEEYTNTGCSCTQNASQILSSMQKKPRTNKQMKMNCFFHLSSFCGERETAMASIPTQIPSSLVILQGIFVPLFDINVPSAYEARLPNAYDCIKKRVCSTALTSLFQSVMGWAWPLGCLEATAGRATLYQIAKKYGGPRRPS